MKDAPPSGGPPSEVPMSESIDQITAENAGNKALHEGHHAQAYAADLPDWHPVRRLLTGSSQWVGEQKPVYVFLRMLCMIYDDFIWPTKPRTSAAGSE